jgi:hypothetical protein
MACIGRQGAWISTFRGAGAAKNNELTAKSSS